MEIDNLKHQGDFIASEGMYLVQQQK